MKNRNTYEAPELMLTKQVSSRDFLTASGDLTANDDFNDNFGNKFNP